MLKFSNANAKTEALKQVPELAEYLKDKRKIYSLDLLSGYSCPYAEKCLSKATVDITTGKRKIKDGLKTEFRCFSASQEVQYNNVYNLRKHNYDTLKQSDNMELLLMDSLPKNAGIVRIHVAGDFFNSEYMSAWWTLAYLNPKVLFYAYTKSLRYWLQTVTEMPILDNFVLTASYGGRDDHLIDDPTFNFRSAKVVFSEAEAEELGLEIDHDDSHAARPSMRDKDFALLIHGTQPKGTKASEALRALKGKGSYSRKKKGV
tara:strand:- start:716 stop:1495 length:780 start_codon:yes stop_codon:yes gene_type:complete